MNHLLTLLGKRVHDLRSAKNWSQEELAHIAGLHRTYVGQVERAEKNLSFENLVKLSTAFGINLAELFTGLEEGSEPPVTIESATTSRDRRTAELRLLDVHKTIKRLKHQLTDVNRTILVLEQSAGNTPGTSPRGRQPKK